MFFLSHCCQNLSLAGNHSPPRLPRKPSNTVLISGPAVGAAQTLIWSSSCVFLPPVNTAVRTRVFSLAGALRGLSYIPQTQSLPSWSCGFNLQLVQLVGRFGVFFLSHTAPGFQLCCISTAECGLSIGVCSWGCPGGLGFAPWGQVCRCCSCLGCRGSGSTRYSGGVGG